MINNTKNFHFNFGWLVPIGYFVCMSKYICVGPLVRDRAGFFEINQQFESTIGALGALLMKGGCTDVEEHWTENTPWGRPLCTEV